MKNINRRFYRIRKINLEDCAETTAEEGRRAIIGDLDEWELADETFRRKTGEILTSQGMHLCTNGTVSGF